MTATIYKKERFVESFGIRIEANQNGLQVSATRDPGGLVLEVEVYRNGLLLKKEMFAARSGWHDSPSRWIPGCSIYPEECGLRVLDMEGNCVVMLDVEEDQFPFMKPQGEQRHVTENYVSVPPALTITDEAGCVWTLGMTTAPKHKSPDGEFAFGVLRNGIDTLEVASRIERRSGKIKIFTADGWKVWTGRSWF